MKLTRVRQVQPEPLRTPDGETLVMPDREVVLMVRRIARGEYELTAWHECVCMLHGVYDGADMDVALLEMWGWEYGDPTPTSYPQEG